MRAIEELKSTVYNPNQMIYNQNIRYDEEEAFPQNQQTIDRIIKLKKILMFNHILIKLMYLSLCFLGEGKSSSDWLRLWKQA